MTLDADAIDTPDLVIRGVLNLAEAKPMAERFLERRGNALLIDAAGVDHLGSQCAQVLMSAFTTWRNDGHAIGLKNASEGFRESVRLLGLTHAFNSEA